MDRLLPSSFPGRTFCWFWCVWVVVAPLASTSISISSSWAADALCACITNQINAGDDDVRKCTSAALLFRHHLPAHTVMQLYNETGQNWGWQMTIAQKSFSVQLCLLSTDSLKWSDKSLRMDPVDFEQLLTVWRLACETDDNVTDSVEFVSVAHILASKQRRQSVPLNLCVCFSARTH